MTSKLHHGLVATLFLTLASSSALADSVTAFLGQAQAPADAACFINGFGAVKNTCATTRRFCIALPVRTSTAGVTVSVQAASASAPVSCFANSVTRYGVSFDITNPPRTSTGTSPMTLFFTNLSIPSNGGLYTCCDIPPNGWLFNATW